MYKYFIVYTWTAGLSQYATIFFGQRFKAYDHEITETDIYELEHELNTGKFERRSVINVIQISNK